jgi:L-ascorbate metabolism protein UlaG (beta-lactamase superfamily)
MKYTYYGHSCFGINAAGKNLLFDPFITGNALAEKIDPDKIKADYILISHGHGDHVGDAVSIAKRTNATVISIYEIGLWFEAQGHKKYHPMNIGGTAKFDFGKVKMVTAIHSSVMPDGVYGGNPAGFIIETDNKTIYYAGDTALTMDMKLIGEYYKLDWAILPIGDNFTMGIDDAIIASDFVKCNKIIGVHYDTFPYIKIDKEKAMAHFKSKGKQLLLPAIGEQVEL